MSFVKQAIGKRSNHSIEGRRGRMMKIQSIYDFLEDSDEAEMIMNLSSYNPKIVKFGRTIKEREKSFLFQDFMNGRVSGDPTEYMKAKHFTTPEEFNA